MKPPVPLEEKTALPAQVAAFLRHGREGKPVDLSDTLVLVPTAGAGRAIRHELSKTGVLSPQFCLPMEALVPKDAPVASRLEREAAWATLLDPAKRARFEALVPGVVPLDNADDRFGAAARLCNVCDQLAEAALSPASPELRNELADDALRWEAFGKLYADYLGLLSDHDLRDPNDVRLAQAIDAAIPPDIRRIVVACVPDLPRVVETFLQSLEKKGVAVASLAWSPAGQAAHLGPLGRPDEAWWAENHPQVSEDCLVSANDSPTEAGLLLDYAAQRKDGGFALFAAAPESAVALAQEIAWRDSVPYLPDGRALAQTEAAEILLGWDEFMRGRRLRDLRVLLQKPYFLSFFTASSRDPANFTPQAALAACDRLIGERLCETVESAESWLKHAEKPAMKKALAEFLGQEDLVRTAAKLLALKRDGRGMFLAVNLHRGTVASGSLAAKELSAVEEVVSQFEASRLLGGLDDDMREAAARSDIARKRIFPVAPPGAIEVQGWLEAPWSAADALIVAGCREGALPSGTHEDPFLPDRAKAKLGLATQDARLARDAYLLSCLLASRPDSRVRLGFARLRNQGETNRPSRLLFGCADSDLPKRSTLLLKPTLPPRRIVERGGDFRLHIPKPSQWPPESIRVTAFKSYLGCPLRFYLGHILRLRTFDADAREIPATDFGTVIHKVLELFSSDDSLKPLREADQIAARFSDILDVVAARYYGTRPTPVVRVQIENMRSRLQSAAVTEAKIRAEGWETLVAEHKVEKGDGRMLGGLAITGTMDRVDCHPEHGLRILDYKTYSQAKNPSKTHTEPRRTKSHLPEADFHLAGKSGKALARTWTDLQLPLYAWLARQIWPEHAAKGVEVGYFLLPPDAEPGKSPIEVFALDAAAQDSAVNCAKRIAELVKAGQFWPPSPSSQIEFDDYKDWFMEGDPADFIDEESAHRLNGNP